MAGAAGLGEVFPRFYRPGSLCALLRPIAASMPRPPATGGCRRPRCQDPVAMPFPATHPALAAALAARGYEEPTPVQSAVLQPEAAGRDLLVSAQTGSGKTVAYGLAAAPPCWATRSGCRARTSPLALVIAPTRELAVQVHRGAGLALCRGGGAHRRLHRRHGRAARGACAGGRLPHRGRHAGAAVRPPVARAAGHVGDPGRGAGRGGRDARPGLPGRARPDPGGGAGGAAHAAVLGHHRARNRGPGAQVPARRAAHRHRLGTRQHADIEYRAVLAAPHEAEQAVVNVLRCFESPTAMVFCSTREMVRHMHGSLAERGFDVRGAVGRAEPGRAHPGAGRAALRRGPGVRRHRRRGAAGSTCRTWGWWCTRRCRPTAPRCCTARAAPDAPGARGRACWLCRSCEAAQGRAAAEAARVQAHWCGAPTADEIRARDGERLLADPMLTEEPTPDELALARSLLAGRQPEEVAAALVRLYRARLPEPEEIRAMAVVPERRPAQTSYAAQAERPVRERVPHARAWRGGRDLVRHADRAARQGRSEVAGPADLPAGRRHQARHRRDPDRRRRNAVRDRDRGGGAVRGLHRGHRRRRGQDRGGRGAATGVAHWTDVTAPRPWRAWSGGGTGRCSAAGTGRATTHGPRAALVAQAGLLTG